MQHGPLVHPDGTTTFRVWAPTAERLTLVTAVGDDELRRGDAGWWSVRTAAEHGDRYALRVDGGEERPDPAARWLPDGVHRRSRVFDPATLAWSPEEARWRPPPLEGGVVYELHVGTFTSEGTLDAAVGHLDDLAELGVTHVELMPVNAFNGTAGWGYDGVAWFAVHEPYGGPAALARFVDAAHRRGLAVLVDAVYNHLGPSGSYLPDFGPYLTDRYTTPWGDALNLDGEDSDEVRAFIVQSALAWLEDFHADGLRLDAVHGLVDLSATHLLAQLSETVAARARSLGRPLVLVAESDRNDPSTLATTSVGGSGMDGQWADDLHHAIHVAVTGEREGYYADYTGLADVATAYRRGFVYDGAHSSYRRRTVGAPLPPDVASTRLVACIQNHDQVGNRALGERLTTLVEPALVRVAALLLCAAPHTPMLFMGEEHGETHPFQYFTSHPEPELAEAVRNGRTAEFAAFAAFAGADVPDPQDLATVQRSTLDRSAAATDEGRARRALWRDLLALRRAQAALGNGRRDLVEEVEVTPDSLVVVRRDPAHAAVAVTANLAETERALPLPPGAWRALLGSDDARYGGAGSEPRISKEAGVATVRLAARSAALLGDASG